MANVTIMSISVKSDIADKLTSICSERGCSRSWLATEALKNYLNQLQEDKDDYQIALESWNDFVESGKKAIPADEVFKMAGL